MSSSNRPLPQCPNITDKVLHPLFDEITEYDKKFHDYMEIDNGWREKPFWVLWIAQPVAVPVNCVDPWGSLTSEYPPGVDESMSDAAADMDLGVELGLKSKPDLQDVITCSICRHEFTCDQDMNLSPLDSPSDEGNTIWEIL